jgi:hypothetical protein
MTEQDFQLTLRTNTYTTESKKRELFNPFLQMEDNRVIQAIQESKLSPEQLKYELEGIIYHLEHNSFLPLKETKSIGAIAGMESGRIIPQPLPIEDIRTELDSKYQLAVKIYGEERVNQFAQLSNQRMFTVLESMPFNPKIVESQDNIFLSLPKGILDDQSIMVPLVNFMMAAKLKPFAGIENPTQWTNPYNQTVETV